jgi:SAM-dependent methyltransferase
MIADALRRARTTLLWLAGPADFVWRLSRGRRRLPPVWLRRHAGPVRGFERAAADMAGLVDQFGLLRESDTVLDAGCGAGAMVPELLRRLSPAGRYVGFDVHAPSIRWCRRRYAGDPRLRFEMAAIASPYGSPTGEPASHFRFPASDAEADLVLAKSLFTHLERPEACRYLSEIRRVLRPGRAALVTTFLFDGDGPTMDLVRREFPFEDPRSRRRYRSRLRPTAAIAYPRADFDGMVEEAGLRVQWMVPGFFPGSSPVTGQDTLLLGH